MGEVVLAAVQPYVTPADYVREGALHDRLARLMQPLAGQGVPTLAVLPEEIGTFLALLGEGDLPRRTPSLEAAFRAVALRHIGRVLTWRLRGAPSLNAAVLLERARVVGPAYVRLVTGLARELGIWLVGGSALLPPGAWQEGSVPPVPSPPRVCNLSLVADPTGRIVHITPKVNLVPGQEDGLGLTPARPEEVGVFSFAGVTVGVLICYDAFTRPHTDHEPSFCPMAPRLAARGARILVQPAANPWWWDEPWPLDPRRLRREQWEQESLEAALAALPHVRFGVTAHLLGRVLDAHFDGRSRIVVRRDDGRVQVLAEARCAQAEPDCAALLTARVEL